MSDKVIKLYYTSVPGNSNMNVGGGLVTNKSKSHTIVNCSDMRKQQQHIEDVLTCKNVVFEKIDISSPVNEKQKQFMRENAQPAQDGKTTLPPQLFYDEEYLGDYEKFTEALEDEQIDEFLKLAVKTKVSQAKMSITGTGTLETLEYTAAGNDQTNLLPEHLSIF